MSAVRRTPAPPHSLAIAVGLAVALGIGSAAGPAAASPDEARRRDDGAIVALAAHAALTREAGPIVAASTAATGRQSDWPADDWEWVDAGPLSLDPDDGRKSILRAVTYSAILPGLGERYVGRETRGRALHAVEAAIWGAFVFYQIQGADRESRHEEFALVRAGAPSGADDDYYEHIGLWLSLEEWHDIVRRDARLRFPDDPAAQEDFFETNKRYDEGEGWSWTNDSERTEYRQLRSKTERSYRNARLAMGAAVFHRLASMIDALALGRRHNSRIAERERAEVRIDLRFGPLALDDDLVVGPFVTARY